jgi:hypothetical protein
MLNGERRDDERRTYNRRVNPTDTPGSPEAEERRVEERRLARRRQRQDRSTG